MDLPVRPDVADTNHIGRRYLQHDDGSWSLVGDDGWPVEPDEYTELDADVANALAAVSSTAVDGDLLLAVRRGLLNTIDVEPISVRDVEQRRELGR